MGSSLQKNDGFSLDSFGIQNLSGLQPQIGWLQSSFWLHGGKFVRNTNPFANVRFSMRSEAWQFAFG